MKHYLTLVLNANGRPLSIISWARAIVIVADGRAHELDFYEGEKIRDGHGKFYTIPAVVILSKFVNRTYKQAPFCKKNVLLRDGLTCQYCGQRFPPSHLTIDHVISREQWKRERREGTPTLWENVVTCCDTCNHRKANKSCKEAKMFPLTTPVKPRHGEMFLGLNPWKDKIPPPWLPYLQHLPLFKGILHVKETSSRDSPLLV